MKSFLSSIARAVVLLALLLVGLWLMSPAAHAQTIVGLHTVSIHAPDGDENNENFGLYVQHKRLIAGFYRNSLDRDTGYVGYVQPLGHGFDVMAGLASGYMRRCESYTVAVVKPPAKHKTAKPATETRERCSGFSRGYLTPALALGYTSPVTLFSATPKLTVVPGLGSKSSTVVHLSLQWSI